MLFKASINLSNTGYEFGGRGSCKGDSGGPLIRYNNLGSHDDDAHYVLIGIVQGGIGKCGSKDFPSIYVRVDHKDVLDFIKEATTGLSN